MLRKLVRCAEDTRLDDVEPVWRVVLLPQDGSGGKGDVLKVGRECGERGVVEGVKGPKGFEERVERLGGHVAGEFYGRRLRGEQDRKGRENAYRLLSFVLLRLLAVIAVVTRPGSRGSRRPPSDDPGVLLGKTGVKW